MTAESSPQAALTTLSEEETLFRGAVREFADEQIRPRSREMEDAAAHPPELIRSLFEMGLMAVDVAEDYGGTGGTFFQSILAVEEVSRSIASLRWLTWSGGRTAAMDES